MKEINSYITWTIMGVMDFYYFLISSVHPLDHYTPEDTCRWGGMLWCDMLKYIYNHFKHHFVDYFIIIIYRM